MSTSPTPAVPATGQKIPIGLYVAIAALALIEFLPLQGMTIGAVTLPWAGKHMLAILAFAIIVWISEALDYTVSAIVISALIIFFVGLSPDFLLPNAPATAVADPEKIFGVNKSLTMALSGFSNSAAILVAAATFIAAAMTVTALDRRIALTVMTKLGASAKSILVGAIVVTIALSLIVPSATARVACVVPIMMGVIAAFKVERKSNLSVALMLVIAQATSIWNVGIQTAAAQNMQSRSFITNILGPSAEISWIDWLIAGAPWSILMSIVLYMTVRIMLPPEVEVVEGGKEALKKDLEALGPMTGQQFRLLLISLVLLGFWSTEKWHKMPTTATTIAGLGLMLLPVVGVMTWPEVQKRSPWGTIIMFAVGISLGGAIVGTKAAGWLAEGVMHIFPLHTLSPLAVFAILSLFLIVIHIGFASATALASSLFPVVVTLLKGFPEGTIHAQGMSMLLAFVVSYGFILPINSPQGMVCMGTDTFSARQYMKNGVVITVIGWLLMLVMAATYWKWLGWM